MRHLVIVFVVFAAVCLSAASTFSQGQFLEKGQSGLLIAGGLVSGDDISGYGFEAGFAAKGLIELGIAAARSSIEATGYYYTGDPREPFGSYNASSETWSTGVFLSEYLVRHKDPRGGEIMLYLQQAMTWTSRDLIPAANAFSVLHLGGGLVFRIPVTNYMRIILDGSYARLLPSKEKYDESNAFDAGLTLQFPFKQGSFVIGPEVGRGEEITTYGVNAGLVLITMGN